MNIFIYSILIIVFIILAILIIRTPRNLFPPLRPEKKIVTEETVKPPTPSAEEIQLNSYYTPAKEKVELDYPPKDIGCCPFSKPLSKDLPIADVPMCYASNAKTYLTESI